MNDIYAPNIFIHKSRNKLSHTHTHKHTAEEKKRGKKRKRLYCLRQSFNKQDYMLMKM